MIPESIIFAESWPRRGKRPPCPRCGSQTLRAPLDNNGQQAHVYCESCNWFEIRRLGEVAKPTDDPTRCNAPGCCRPIKQQRLCVKHWQRWYQAGKPCLDQFIEAGAPIASHWRRKHGDNPTNAA